MTIDIVDGLVAGASLAAPQQFRIIRDFDVAMIAQACSLEPSDIEVRRHPPCLASCGAPFVIAEVRDRAALRRAQQRMDVFLSHLPRDEVTGIHLYVEEAEEAPTFNRECSRRCMGSSKTLRLAAQMLPLHWNDYGHSFRRPHFARCSS